MFSRGSILYLQDKLTYIQCQIGHITCDNTSNNDTMLAEFARRYARRNNGKVYDVDKKHIR